MLVGVVIGVCYVFGVGDYVGALCDVVVGIDVWVVECVVVVFGCCVD